MRRIVVTFSVLLISMAVSPVVRAGPSSEPLDYREVRPKLFGPPFATGKDYVAHSPQAIITDGKVQCAGPAAPQLPDAEYQKRLSAIRAEQQAVNDAVEKEKADLRQRYWRKELTDAQATSASLELEKKKSAAATKGYEADIALQQEARESAQAASGNVGIFLVHAPSDPNATIIPLDQSAAPTQAFLAELNQTLKPFLTSCGDRANIGVGHYFKDISKGAGKDLLNGQLFEGHIASYYYTLRGGLLALNAPDRGSYKFKLFHDAEHNDLTLASVKASWEKFHLVQAEYRKDFAIAAKRKPGIVYKLDPYWAAYTPDSPAGRSVMGYFDKARRMFDGDFTLIHKSQEFRVLFMDYGEVFSQRCKAQVKSFVTYKIPNQVITKTKTFLDGHQEHEYENRPIPYPIDARFDPQWGQWYQDRDNYRAKDLMQNMFSAKGGKSFAQMTTKEFGDRTREFLDMQTKTISPITAFFDQHTCTSATMAQLGENLIRAANGRPSLQAEGLKLAGADAESDPPSQ